MIFQSSRDRLYHARGPFRIWRSYPGRGVSDDSGLGPIGTVDHADLLPGLHVPMHEHRDDEIVSYLRSGHMRHTDSHGASETISAKRLMVMNAGRGFSHEESIPTTDAAGVEMLQIFLRPSAAGLDPAVQFVDLEDRRSGIWRVLTGPKERGAKSFVRTDVDLLDATLAPSEETVIPTANGYGWWLYIFHGQVIVEGQSLSVGDSVACPSGNPCRVVASGNAELVCMRYGKSATYTDRGSLSGRRR